MPPLVSLPSPSQRTRPSGPDLNLDLARITHNRLLRKYPLMSFLMSYVLKPLAYLSLPALVLRYLSERSPVVRYYVRLSTYLSTLGVLSIWGVLVSLGMTAAGQRFDINWVVARSFYITAGRIMGIDFKVEGEEHMNVPSAIFIGNHQSMLDILYLGRRVFWPAVCSIMAKKELQWMPLLGQYMSLSGAVFVDRSNNKDALKALAAAGDDMKSKGVSLWVFPEGTRSSSEAPNLLPFKKGAFHLAVQAGVPIIPVVCENYWRLYRKGTLDEGSLRIRVLPPISTQGLTPADVTELAERTREQMLDVLREISVTVPATSETKREATPKPAVIPQPVPTPESVSESVVDVREMLPKGKPMESSTATLQGNESEATDEDMVVVDRP
ncbi:acyltransferase [Ceratobasidium sp. AG-Ba]|nr:acyltransferase [Ceratobasidium sp. AG-Ba]QRW01400.1 acyltransferase [Ceratobasidium sp. AG-Ba]